MEPRKDEQQIPDGNKKEPAKKRFQIHKLEDRIAPKGNCHFNPHNRLVGCGNDCQYGCW